MKYSNKTSTSRRTRLSEQFRHFVFCLFVCFEPRPYCFSERYACCQRGLNSAPIYLPSGDNWKPDAGSPVRKSLGLETHATRGKVEDCLSRRQHIDVRGAVMLKRKWLAKGVKNVFVDAQSSDDRFDHLDRQLPTRRRTEAHVCLVIDHSGVPSQPRQFLAQALISFPT